MRGIKIGSAFGIPVRLNWTFLLVLPIFAFLIGLDIGQLATLLNDTLGAEINTDSLEVGYRPWLLGFLAASGLFTGVLLHEFGHSLVAMRYGYEIDSITLWLLGGLANFAQFPEDWRHEFWISVAGPIVSVGVGAVSYALFLSMPAGFDAGLFVFGYLAILNVALAVFNMLPAFPMDGGRVLRALLARTRPRAQATQTAAEIGKVFAFLLGIFGLFSSLFLILLAFFIYIAASREAQQTSIKAAFEDVTVRDVMTPREKLHVVSPATTVEELIGRMFRERHTGYPVVEDGKPVGMITLDDAREVRQVEREAYEVAEVMSRDLSTIEPEANAMEAHQQIQQESVGRLPVVEDGQLVGLISRTDLMTAFDIIQSSGSPTAFTDRGVGGRDFQFDRRQ
jgi:Zn-dependent protease/predicted transcriptional regulator